jgi:hypothetical protein
MDFILFLELDPTNRWLDGGTCDSGNSLLVYEAVPKVPNASNGRQITR